MNHKKTIVVSLLTIVMCLALIAGSTYALFTSEDKVNIAVTSGKVSVTATVGNIKTSSLGVDQAAGAFANGGSAKLDESAHKLSLTNITPGDKVTFDITVKNDSNVNIQYRLVWTVEGELADYLEITNNQNLGWTVWEIPATEADKVKVISVSIKLPEEFTTQNLGDASISFKVEAIQGNAFTGDADFYVLNTEDLIAALAEAGSAENAGQTTEIVLLANCDISESLNVGNDVVINGGGYTIARKEGFTGTVFSAKEGSTLTLEDVVVDGGAVWTGDVDPTLGRGTVNSGVAATGDLIAAEKNATIVLNEGAILQNNVGAYAVNLGTRIGATLTLNGAQIINNSSGSGAIWGGGNIVVNENSKINGNSSTGIAGVIRMVSSCNLTINGGEINHNKAAGDGGVIWGYGSSTYTFTGGEMAYNVSGGVGGAIYTGTYSNINISGTFEMHDNSAKNSGAIRLTDHTSLTMTGGKIYDNKQNGESNAFNTWNNSMTIIGGEIWDNFVFTGGLGLTIGAADIEGVINYNLSTNHNTAYLAADFKGFSFTANEAANNFANFNFKPAADYVYTEGDENKLVCLNEGYETYWDAATGTFRLQATN